MSAIPEGVDTDRQPPMTVPLGHFLVGLGFLVAGGLLAALDGLDAVPGLASLAGTHLLLVGWVCLTIMGAMTQFVPVWSGVDLHSRRLSLVQLPLVAGGLVGFASALLLGALDWLLPFGGAMVLGFWTFVYNVGRTLAAARPFDVTERHFALALGFFVLVTLAGLSLAAWYRWPAALGWVPRARLAGAHATLAVFGVVLTTVVGALSQLATMFTQSDFDDLDRALRRVEGATYPAGVLGLAAGRLFGVAPLARVGGGLVAVGLLTVGIVLLRRLSAARLDPTPMLRRYAVAGVATCLWALLAGGAWVGGDPLSPATRFGAAGTVHLLVLGVVGFVVLGTLYHVVPFIVWVHRYSDRIGYEPVPMVDDLYDDRVAAVDLVAVLFGTALLVAADLGTLPPVAAAAGGVATTVGFALCAANLVLVVHEHGPRGIAGIFVPSRSAE